LYVQHDSISRTSACGHTHLRVNCYIVALVAVGWLLHAVFAMGSSVVQAVECARTGIDKHPRTGYHFRILRRSQRDLDYLNAKQLFLRRGPTRTFRFASGWRRVRWKSRCTAINAAIWHLDRHKHQVLVDRHISLSTRTNHRGDQPGLSRIGDVIDVDTIKIAL